ISISKIPLVIIALLPTKGNDTTQEIFTILKKIVKISIQANINILSIDADGAITKFNAQILFMQGNNIQEF
ncbi:11942_t:CDS:1, partial [Gigaspora margarita]